MKFVFAIAAAALAMTASPSMANDFSGLHAQITAGTQNVAGKIAAKSLNRSDVTYGADVGVDLPLGQHVVVGVDAGLDNIFDRRQVNATARFGVAPVKNVLVYGRVGYSNYRDVLSQNLDGLRFGGGAEVNISKHTFVSAEYLRTNLNNNVNQDTVKVGLGLRF